jgi:hypothetical protein
MACHSIAQSCGFRPDAPCDGNGVMPGRPRLQDEFAADAAAGSENGDAHGASVSDECHRWSNRYSPPRVPAHPLVTGSARATPPPLASHVLPDRDFGKHNGRRVLLSV